MRSVLSVLLLAGAAGCSNLLGPGGIDGKWTQPFTVPGNSFEMDLVTHGSTVSGTGTWSAEACCGGPVGVTGTINDGAVHLDIAQTVQFGGGGIGSTSISHFDGRLILHFLRGTIKPVRDPPNETGQDITYVRE